MCPFNQDHPDSDEAVIVALIKSGHFLARNRVPVLHALSPAERRPPAPKDTTSPCRASVSKAAFSLHGF